VEISQRTRDSHTRTAKTRFGEERRTEDQKTTTKSTTKGSVATPVVPVLKCRAMAGFQVSTEVYSSASVFIKGHEIATHAGVASSDYDAIFPSSMMVHRLRPGAPTKRAT
jgi:hypothetical protein